MPFIPDAIRMPWNRAPDKAAPNTTLLYPKSDNNWYSKSAAGVETLVGGPAMQNPWASYTPTLTGFAVSSSTAFFGREGKVVHVEYRAVLSGAVTADMAVSLPINAARTPDDWAPIGVAHALDVETIRRSGLALLPAANSMVKFFVDNSTAPWGATSPFTWASGDKISFSVTYEGV